MGRSSYGHFRCRQEGCDKRITNAGFAVHAHMMSHVRKGELVHLESVGVGNFGHLYVAPDQVEKLIERGRYRRA